MCKGSEANWVCPVETQCIITGTGVLILCLAYCDPHLQDCYEGGACYPSNEGFWCSPQASGTSGSFGDPCEFLNTCDPGLFCAVPEEVPSCGAEVGCCNAFCDITATRDCPGAEQECVPWYGAGMAPPGLESVGACALR